MKTFFLAAAFTALAVVGIASAQNRGSCIQNCSQDDRGSWTCHIICK
jgi:triosephosphate isomerase